MRERVTVHVGRWLAVSTIAFILWAWLATCAHAQAPTAKVISCGHASLVKGQWTFVPVDSAGRVCVNSSSSSGGNPTGGKLDTLTVLDTIKGAVVVVTPAGDTLTVKGNFSASVSAIDSIRVIAWVDSVKRLDSLTGISGTVKVNCTSGCSGSSDSLRVIAWIDSLKHWDTADSLRKVAVLDSTRKLAVVDSQRVVAWVDSLKRLDSLTGISGTVKTQLSSADSVQLRTGTKHAARVAIDSLLHPVYLDSVSLVHLGASDTVKAKVFTPANDTLRVNCTAGCSGSSPSGGWYDSVRVVHLGASDTIKAKVFTPANDTLTVKGNFSASLSPSTTNRCGLQAFAGTLNVDSLGLCISHTGQRRASQVINSGTSVLTRISVSTSGMQSCAVHFTAIAASGAIVGSAQLSSDSGRTWYQTVFFDGNNVVGLSRMYSSSPNSYLSAPIDWDIPIYASTTNCAFITDSTVGGTDTVTIATADRPSVFTKFILGGQYSSPGLVGSQIANPVSLAMGGRDSTDTARSVYVLGPNATVKPTDQPLVTILSSNSSLSPQYPTDTMIIGIGGKTQADSVVLPAKAGLRHYITFMSACLTDTLALAPSGSSAQLQITSTNLPGGGNLWRLGGALAVGGINCAPPGGNAFTNPLVSLSQNTVTKIKAPAPAAGGYWTIVVMYYMKP